MPAYALTASQNATRVRVNTTGGTEVQVQVGNPAEPWISGAWVEVVKLNASTASLRLVPYDGSVTLNLLNGTDLIENGSHARVVQVQPGEWDVTVFAGGKQLLTKEAFPALDNPDRVIHGGMNLTIQEVDVPGGFVNLLSEVDLQAAGKTALRPGTRLYITGEAVRVIPGPGVQLKSKVGNSESQVAILPIGGTGMLGRAELIYEEPNVYFISGDVDQFWPVSLNRVQYASIEYIHNDFSGETYPGYRDWFFYEHVNPLNRNLPVSGAVDIVVRSPDAAFKIAVWDDTDEGPPVTLTSSLILGEHRAQYSVSGTFKKGVWLVVTSTTAIIDRYRLPGSINTTSTSAFRYYVDVTPSS